MGNKTCNHIFEMNCEGEYFSLFSGWGCFLLRQKREDLTVQQEALSHKREVLMADGEGPEAEDRLLQEIGEELEVLNANIDYINDSLSDCQATIVQIEETKVQTHTHTHTHTGTRTGQLYTGLCPPAG